MALTEHNILFNFKFNSVLVYSSVCTDEYITCICRSEAMLVLPPPMARTRDVGSKAILVVFEGLHNPDWKCEKGIAACKVYIFSYCGNSRKLLHIFILFIVSRLVVVKL